MSGPKIFLKRICNQQVRFCAVYLRPNKHLEYPAGYILKFLRLLYGLAYSSDYWHATFAERLKKKLGMKTVASDMSLFFRRARGQLTGLLAS